MNLGCKLPPKTYHIIKYVSSKTWLRSISLSYKLVGEGSTEKHKPPIFILHGLISRRRHWKGLALTIHNMTKRSVITIDLRNHGSSPHTNSHKYDEMAKDVIELLDKLEVPKASLVGHDMGGRTAMCVALTKVVLVGLTNSFRARTSFQPARVAGLLVVDISPVSTDPEFTKLYDLLVAMKAVDFKLSKTVSKARKEAKRQLKDVTKNDVIMNEVLSNIQVKPDRIIGWGCNLDILIKYFKNMASFPSSLNETVYPGPTIFIGGQLSDYIPPDDLTNIRQLFPGAVITYIKGAGHYLHVEDPRAFLERAIAFLRTNY